MVPKCCLRITEAVKSAVLLHCSELTCMLSACNLESCALPTAPLTQGVAHHASIKPWSVENAEIHVLLHHHEQTFLTSRCAFAVAQRLADGAGKDWTLDADFGSAPPETGAAYLGMLATDALLAVMAAVEKLTDIAVEVRNGFHSNIAWCALCLNIKPLFCYSCLALSFAGCLLTA